MDPVAGLDVVYIIRAGDTNEALRHSLRSLVNLPEHGQLWIVGHKPSWVYGAGHIPGNRHATKPRNVWDNIRLACTDDRLTDRIILMNDDFYIMRPTPHIPNWYRGPLTDHIASISRRSDWCRSLISALDWLNAHGHTNPHSYELHKPIILDRARMAEVMNLAANQTPTTPP